MRFVFGIVGIAARIEGVERAPIIWIQRKPQRYTLRQVRVRDEVTAERDEGGVAVSHRGLRRIGFEATRGDDWAVEDFAQLLRGNWAPRGYGSPHRTRRTCQVRTPYSALG
jgi:hypothetical protein